MFRKSILASTLSLLLLPSAGWGLGLGGIRPESALNQPFVGEIDLIGVSPEQLDTIKVILAPEEEFAKRGTERQASLSKLRFRPQVSPRGKLVVRVTSTEPIREPYMDFLVEVIWPKGRLVKGYTVLLDPPVTGRRAPPSVEPAVIQVQPSPSGGTRAAAPSAGASAETSAGTSGGAGAAKAPVRPAAQPVMPAAGAANTALRFGPVKPGTNLWRVAHEMAPAGATVYQTAMALYRNNQQAFVRGNINRLRQGQVLQIPSTAEIFAMDAADAQREFRAALSGGRVTAAPLTKVAAEQVQGESRLRIAGAAQPAATAPTEGQATGPAGGAETPSLEQELLLVRETGESTRQETDELRARVHQLEARLVDIQQVLTLRDAELARLQAGQAASGGVSPGAAGQTDSAALSRPAPGVPEVQQETVQRGPEATPSGAGAEEARSSPTPVAEAPSEGAPAGHQEVQSGPVEVPGREAMATGATAGVRESEGATGGTGSDQEVPAWAGDLPLVGGALKGLPAPVFWSGLVAVPLLALLGWISTRRRRDVAAVASAGLPGVGSSMGEEASTAVVGRSQAARTVHGAGQGDAQGTSTEDTLGLGPEEEDEGASDMVSEADIYIAYGRYRDAEDLLKQAITRFPRRSDLRYRLAEVYAGARNQAGLAALLAEMEGAGMDRDQPEQWQRLVDQARSVPKSAGEGSPAGLASAATTAAAAFDLGDLTFGAVGQGGDGQGRTGTQPTPDQRPDQTRDLGQGRPFAMPFGDVDGVSPEAADSLVMDFNRQLEPTFGIESFDLGTVVTTAEPAGSKETGRGSGPRGVPGHAGLALDLSDLTPATELDLEELGVLAPSPPSPAGAAGDRVKGPSLADSEQDLHFGSIIGLDTLPSADASEGSAPATEDLVQAWAEPAQASAAGPRGLGDGTGDHRFKIEVEEADTLSSELFSSQWHIDAGAWDEAATKLDLGRAYVEMNDRQAAEALLLEVAEEGNPEQQAEARGLLAGLKAE